MAELRNLSIRVGTTEFRRNTVNALAWLKEKYQLLIGAKINQRRILQESNNVPVPIMGRMYFYRYNPKTASKLPYYDFFPLVIPIENYGANNILGINFHYLPYNLRTILMSNLIEGANMNEGAENFKIRYRNIKGINKFKQAVPCLHRYDLTKVASKIIEVKPDDWATAIYLPVEQFVKKDKSFVWSESKRIIQGL